LVVALVQFFLLPFIIGHVGKEIYGVYLLVLTFTGYLALIDFGVMSALTKYVSEFRGRGDAQGLGNIINASFTFYVLVGLVIGGALLAAAGVVPQFFRIQPQDIATAQKLFVTAGCTALVVWPLNTFRGAVQGFNKWNVDATVSISVQVLSAAATVLILRNGGGMEQVFLANQLLLIAGSLALGIYLRREFGVRVHFPYTDWKTFRFIFDFSLFIFLSSMLNIFLFQIHNVVIGSMISMSAVAVYAVAFNLQIYLRSINSILGAPPWTIASEMEGRKDYSGQRYLLLRGTKYMGAVFLPAIIILCIFTEPFIIYWMGEDFRASILPGRVLVAFWLLNGTIELATGMLSAKGIVRQPLRIQIIMVLVNLAVIFLFIKKIGILAPALGLAIAMIFVWTPLALRLIFRTLNINVREYFDQAVRCNLTLYIFTAGLALLGLQIFYPASLTLTILEMAAIYLLSALFYYFFVLSSGEQAEALRLFPLRRSFLRQTKQA